MGLRILLVLVCMVLASCAVRTSRYNELQKSTARYFTESEMAAIRQIVAKSGGSTNIQDWRVASTRGQCPVHKKTMDEVVVPGLRGEIYMEGDFKMEDHYPYSGIEYSTNLYADRVGIIYICPDCHRFRHGAQGESTKGEQTTEAD